MDNIVENGEDCCNGKTERVISNWLCCHLTIKDILNDLARLFKDANIETPRLEAELLFAKAINCKIINLYTESERKIEEQEILSLVSMIKRRLKREPLQYILGHTEFMSNSFFVNQDVLIPRPETELIVESVLEIVNDREFADEGFINIFDICTGSGNIGISIAIMLKCARVFASDISGKALEVAKANAKRNMVEESVVFIHGDLFEPFGTDFKDLRADFIVSNPPYVAEDELHFLAPEVIRHEPKISLIAGGDGLAFYKRILTDAAFWLKDGGFLILEIGDKQRDSVKDLIMSVGVGQGLQFIKSVKDLQRIDRVVVIRKRIKDEACNKLSM